eukprot:g2158.t1
MTRGRRAASAVAWCRGLAAAGLLSFSLHRLWGVYSSQTSTDNGRALPISLRDVSHSDRRESEDSHRPGSGGGLVLIKSFKTGSTTLATYIAQVGHQKGCHFLHPRAKGWFERGELESRRDLGHKFDISLRHVTPYTPYGVLDDLVPGAAYVTIMRRPVERFLSLFNFRDELKRKFQTPQALVEAIRAGRLPQSDARPFCNQLAWLMSGKNVDYTGIVDEAEVNRVAGEVIAEADKRGMVVLLTERMSESFAILANRMQWDLDSLNLIAGSQRVQGDKHRYYVCPGTARGIDDECSSAIRGCNLVDEVLYKHYERRFEHLLRELPSPMSTRASTLLEGLPKAEASMSQFDLGKFPTICISDGAQDVEGPDGHGVASGITPEELYRRLHSCNGRPRPP